MRRVERENAGRSRIAARDGSLRGAAAQSRSSRLARAVDVVGRIVVVALVTGACAPPTSSPDAGHVVERSLPFAHSHNDETRDEPLYSSLALGIASVEADVLMYEGQMIVAHDLFTLTGGLDVVYLDDLQARVDERGSVFGDGAPFTLWIDLKVGDAALRDAVFDALERYDMLTRFTADSVDERAVTAVLTGDGASKAAFIDDHPTRRACRDSNAISDADPPADTAFRYYALDFADVVGAWDGTGAMPADQRANLDDVVARAHAKDRPLRLWNAPDTAASWQAQKEAGVDFVGADDIEGLAAALRE